MYLLNERRLKDTEEGQLKPVLKSVAPLGHGSPALEADYSSKTSAKLLEENFSETARETLKVLRGEWSGGPSYDKLYSVSTEVSPTVQRDVAQAMAYRWSHDGRGYGAFDEIALELFRRCFDRFEDSGAASFTQTQRRGSPTICPGFDGLRRSVLNSFLDENYDRSLSFQFDLDAAKSPVKLNLDISALGSAFWELRGASQLKKSHRKLRDDLQAVVRDFRSRMGWMSEYMSLKPRPGIEEPQLVMVQKILKNYYHHSAFDLEPLNPGVRFEDEPLILDEDARGFPGRCVVCDQIVAVELVTHIGSSIQKPDWTEDRLLYRNSYAENTLYTEVFSPVHWACRGTRYLSSRTGENLPISNIHQH